MKRAFAATSVVILLFGTSAMPAFAGCDEELKKVEKEVTNWQGDPGTREFVDKLLAQARKAQEEGKKRRCLIKIKVLRGKL